MYLFIAPSIEWRLANQEMQSHLEVPHEHLSLYGVLCVGGATPSGIVHNL